MSLVVEMRRGWCWPTGDDDANDDADDDDADADDDRAGVRVISCFSALDRCCV